MSSVQDSHSANKNDKRASANSPERNGIPEITPATSFFDLLTKKDKENQELHREIEKYKEKIKEFEYLIFKASEEVKRKQSEINALTSQLGNPCNSTDLQRQLIDTKAELKTLEAISNQTQLQLRTDLIREKELSRDFEEKVKDLKIQLEKAVSDGKINSENLQKQTQKFLTLQNDNEVLRKTHETLKQDMIYKDQTIANAHQVIKKLKLELEELSEENENLQAKVKEYKAKCKTLKKNNLTHVESIKDLEKRATLTDQYKKELDKARDDLAQFIKARMDDKFRVDSQKLQLSNDSVELQKHVGSLQEQVNRLQEEKSSLNNLLIEEQMKTKELCREVVDKDDIIKQLNENLRAEQERVRSELDGFKSTAIKSLQLIQTEIHPNKPSSRSASPHHPSPLNSQGGISNNFDSKVTGEPSKYSSEVVQKSQSMGNIFSRRSSTGSKRPGCVKSIPIKNYGSKGNESITFNDSIDLEHPPNPVQSKNVSMNYMTEKMVHFQIDESPEETIQHPPQKDAFTVEFLKEQLHKSVEREHYYALVMEAVACRGEAETKRILEKFSSFPLVPPEVEGWRMRCEELETRYMNTVEKYQKASSIIFDLIQNNKVLSDRVNELLITVKSANDSYDGCTRLLVYETHFRQDRFKQLMTDAQNLAFVIENNDEVSQRDNKFNSELIKRLRSDCEKYKNDLKHAEELVDTAKLFQDENECTFARSTHSSAEKYNSGSKKKSLTVKLNIILRNARSQIIELEEEKKRLLDKFDILDREIKEIRDRHAHREAEFLETIKQKDRDLDAKQRLIIEKEEMILRRRDISHGHTERSTSTARKQETTEIINLLNEKEEALRILMMDKQALFESLDQANKQIADLKKFMRSRGLEYDQPKSPLNRSRTQLDYFDDFSLQITSVTDRSKNDPHKERIVELQGEIMNLSKELEIRDKEVKYKEGVIAEKNNAITTLNDQIALLREKIDAIHNRLENPSNVFPGILRNSTSEDYQSAHFNLENSRKESSKVQFPTEDFEKMRTESATLRAESATLRAENETLRQENKDFLKKMTQLNELISSNKALEEEIYEKKSPLKSTQRPLEAGDMTSRPTTNSPFTARNFFEGDIGSLRSIEDYQNEKDVLKQLKENIKDKDTLLFIESYKSKTKKVFQKRVRELEMVLRYLDLKIRGFNFKKQSYILPSGQNQSVSYDQSKNLGRVATFVEGFLEKNETLNNFVNAMQANVEKLYVKQYNLTAGIAKIIRALFMNAINSDNMGYINQLDMLSDIESLIEFRIPGMINKFEQIETFAAMDGKPDFFSAFDKVESKLNFFSDYMLTTLRDNSDVKTSMSQMKTKLREFVGVKLDKVKDIEGLYTKLKGMIEGNSSSTLENLQENLRNYVQTYDNIFNALFGEINSLVNHVLQVSESEKSTSNTSYSNARKMSSAQKGILQNLSSFGNYQSTQQSHPTNPNKHDSPIRIDRLSSKENTPYHTPRQLSQCSLDGILSQGEFNGNDKGRLSRRLSAKDSEEVVRSGLTLKKYVEF